jgi:hypothetical protein
MLAAALDQRKPGQRPKPASLRHELASEASNLR